MKTIKISKQSLADFKKKQVVIKYIGLSVVGAFIGEKCVGRCSYVVHEDSYYNSIEDRWTSNFVNIYDWLVFSVREKYPDYVIVRE